MEAITQWWHYMYHIFTFVPFLHYVLPPFLYCNKEEASTIIVMICNMQVANPLQPTPYTILLFKMFLFAQGDKQPMCHPTKGGTWENFLRWIELSFNYEPWCPIKKCYRRKGCFICMLHKCFFMPKMEVIGGTKIWNSEKGYWWIVGWIHCLDTTCTIVSNVSNGCGK